MKGLFFFFESVGVPGGSPELGKGNRVRSPQRRKVGRQSLKPTLMTCKRDFMFDSH